MMQPNEQNEQNEPTKPEPFDIELYEFSDDMYATRIEGTDDLKLFVSDPLVTTSGRLKRDDAIAIAKSFKLTAKDLEIKDPVQYEVVDIDMGVTLARTFSHDIAVRIKRESRSTGRIDIKVLD